MAASISVRSGPEALDPRSHEVFGRPQIEAWSAVAAINKFFRTRARAPTSREVTSHAPQITRMIRAWCDMARPGRGSSASARRSAHQCR
jgi:hypothetical protein